MLRFILIYFLDREAIGGGGGGRRDLILTAEEGGRREPLFSPSRLLIKKITKITQM